MCVLCRKYSGCGQERKIFFRTLPTDLHQYFAVTLCLGVLAFTVLILDVKKDGLFSPLSLSISGSDTLSAYLFLHLHNMPERVNQGLKSSLMRRRKVVHLLITDESKPTEADIKNAPNWLHNASESTPEHLAALLYQKYASPWHKSGIKYSPFLVGNLFTL